MARIESLQSPDWQSNISDCPEPFAKWYCLNGATCFSVKLHEAELYNCWCRAGYHGLRCDYKHLTVNVQNDQHAESSNKPNNSGFNIAVTPQGNQKEVIEAEWIAVVADRQHKIINKEHVLLYNLLFFGLGLLLLGIVFRYFKRRALYHQENAVNTTETLTSVVELTARRTGENQSEQRVDKRENMNHENISIYSKMKNQH